MGMKSFVIHVLVSVC